MGLIVYLKEVMKSERGFLQALLPFIPTGISLLSKMFGGGAAGGYPQFNYGEQDWSKIYNMGMAGPRREASRFSQAATKTTLPGGPRIQAQQAVGGRLMGQANEMSGRLAQLRIPYEMQQQGWRREDALRKFAMGKQDWGNIFQTFFQGLGMSQGGQGMDFQQMMEILRGMGGGQGGQRGNMGSSYRGNPNWRPA